MCILKSKRDGASYLEMAFDMRDGEPSYPHQLQNSLRRSPCNMYAHTGEAGREFIGKVYGLSWP
jgi:hypothetical protein